ncbi:MAG TPA: YihY/virulence factor BrkB family protein [Gemmatimonadales bacterium]
MRVPQVIRMFGAALSAWLSDGAPRLGASLAYYTLFSLGPILVVSIAIAGAAFGEEAVQGRIVTEIDGLVGTEGARAVQALLQAASREEGGTIATILGALTFVLATTGAFLELQYALNRVWRVQPKPGLSVRAFLLDRLRSFGLVVAIGFLLLVSLAVSAALAALGDLIGKGSGFPAVWMAVNTVVSLGVVATLFALLYKFLPDVELRWRDVWIGAIITAVLFTLGKSLIGLYLGRSATASSYGAAGSIVVLMLWVYYTSQVVLLGAEFTRVFTRTTRARPEPQEFAEPAHKA